MAGLRWFKVSADLMRHKKSQALARRLEDERAWAYVVQMWAWFCEQAGTGEQLGPDAAYQIARGAGWRGDVDEFCRHMVASGFLDAVPEGFKVHDWKEWAGAHVEYQRRDAARKKKIPRTSTPGSDGVPSDIPRTSSGTGSESPQECISTLLSVSEKSSDGGAGGVVAAAKARTRRVGIGGGLPAQASPGSEADYPLTAAVLAALCERDIHAEWPAEKSLAKVERAIAFATVPVAVERLAAVLPKTDKPCGLGWHLETINPPRGGKGPQPVGKDFTKTLGDL